MIKKIIIIMSFINIICSISALAKKSEESEKLKKIRLIRLTSVKQAKVLAIQKIKQIEQLKKFLKDQHEFVTEEIAGYRTLSYRDEIKKSCLDLIETLGAFNEYIGRAEDPSYISLAEKCLRFEGTRNSSIPVIDAVLSELDTDLKKLSSKEWVEEENARVKFLAHGLSIPKSKTSKNTKRRSIVKVKKDNFRNYSSRGKTSVGNQANR